MRGPIEMQEMHRATYQPIPTAPPAAALQQRTFVPPPPPATLLDPEVEMMLQRKCLHCKRFYTNASRNLEVSRRPILEFVRGNFQKSRGHLTGGLYHSCVSSTRAPS